MYVLCTLGGLKKNYLSKKKVLLGLEETFPLLNEW